MYPEFLATSRLESWERRMLSLQRLLSIMECYPGHPEYRVHRATLRYLATHLARVASRQAVNRMTAYNLALVFAPNLIQSSEDSAELFMADSKFKIWVKHYQLLMVTLSKIPQQSTNNPCIGPCSYWKR